jgi:hypothetical protein
LLAYLGDVLLRGILQPGRLPRYSSQRWVKSLETGAFSEETPFAKPLVCSLKTFFPDCRWIGLPMQILMLMLLSW